MSQGPSRHLHRVAGCLQSLEVAAAAGMVRRFGQGDLKAWVPGLLCPAGCSSISILLLSQVDVQKVSHVPQAKALCAAGSQTWVQKLKGCGSCSCKAAWCTRKPGLPQQQLCATPPLYAGGVLKACLGTAVNIMHLFYQRGFIAPSPASSSCLFLDIYLFGVFFLILLYSHLTSQLVGAEFWLSVCR